MPLIEKSTYKPSLIFRNKHVNTIYPSLFRKVNGVVYKRKRIDTPDSDFLDLDCIIDGNKNLLVVLHGMEGDSNSIFVKGTVKCAIQEGWDAVAMNLRSCSGELNRLFSSYHCGKSDDLEVVINYLKTNYDYENIFIVGYSLGGNVLLKYLGEQSNKTPKIVKAAVAISVPTHLESSSEYFKKTTNKIYLNRFLKALKQKVHNKIINLQDSNITLQEIEAVKNFREFDDLYTAPVHGFKDAIDYYTSSSSHYFIREIKVPTLLINAKDDPFLPKECYPFKKARESKYFHLETPNYGGHVGFVNRISLNCFWHEKRIIDFLKKGI